MHFEKKLWLAFSGPCLSRVGQFVGISAVVLLAGCEMQPSTTDVRAEQHRLQTLGYVGGMAQPQSAQAITVHKTKLVREGLNLYTPGGGPQAVLMDMDGRVLHRWSYPFLDAFGDLVDFELPPELDHWRRVHLFPNGDLLAIVEGVGMLKLDRNSKLLWARDNMSHHDLDVMPDGRIFTLTRKAHIVPRVDPAYPVLEDFVSILDAEGKVLEQHSLLEAFERSNVEVDFQDPDLFHTNSLEVLTGSAEGANPAFRAGNVLISLRHQNLIAVYDLESKRIVWWRRGDFQAQHDPKILANQNLLLFDNSGSDNGSTIYEFDLAKWRVVWKYRGTYRQPFDSPLCGTAQRLENGNTLITESSRGRAFEVTRRGKIVWEFHSPHRIKDDPRFVAELFEVLRLPENFSADWASGPSS